MITLQPMNICSVAADLLWSRVIKEFPDIKIALSEGGTGWIPYFLDRLDRTYDMHRAWTGQDFGDKVPSDVFREHFLTCFISDPVGIELRHTIGIDNIAWECDYPTPTRRGRKRPRNWQVSPRPFPTTNWPRSASRTPVAGTTSTRSAPRPRASTVGALRREAAGHDVSIRSFDKGRFEHSHGGIDIGQLAGRATA